MEWDDKKVMKLIDLYRSKRLLWDPKHGDYKKRPNRHEAYNDIATELFTSVIEVERKIKNVTSHYYREKKKEYSSNKSDADADEMYQSKWFAYKSLHFLSNKNLRTGTIGTNKPRGRNLRLDSQDSQTSTENTSKPNKRLKNDEKDEMVSEALTIMRYISERQNASKEKDEDGLFGDYIASQLRKMDRSTKAIARHRINNIIYEAESGSRADTFPDSRPSSAHSHTATMTVETPATNCSTSVYYAQSSANPLTAPLDTMDGEDTDMVTSVKIEGVEDSSLE